MAKAKRKSDVGDVATNRRARHKFELLDRFECGIELVGTEVKSLREGKAQLGDAYAVIERGEVSRRRSPRLQLISGHRPGDNTISIG